MARRGGIVCLAIPGRIVSIGSEPLLFRRARVAFGTLVKEVSLACVPEAREGQFVLVHAGLAIAIVHEGRARATLAELGIEQAPVDDEDRPPTPPAGGPPV
jgi:hydrogenase expression/formation protein HypC